MPTAQEHAVLASAARRHDVPPLVRDMVGRIPVDAQKVFRRTVYIITGAVAAAAAAVALLTYMGRLPWDDRFYTDWMLLCIVAGAGPYGMFYLRDVNRVAAIDEKFPDFLRDLAESARSGMTLPRALQAAARGSYGRLTPEIERMSAQVEWGVSFTDALERFAHQVRSPLVTRTVSLIIEARRAGGNVVDVLTAASEDAREILQVVKQRNNQMASYSTVVYITFLVFLAVVLVLQEQLVPAFVRAAGASGGQVSFGGVSLGAVDAEAFETVFFHAAIIQAVTGGLVAGVLTRGNPVAGLRAILVMLVFCEFAFRVLGALW